MKQLPSTSIRRGFEKFSKGVMGLLGEQTDFGEQVGMRNTHDLLKEGGAAMLQDYLPYQTYSPKGYYRNRNSCGLFFECTPMMGVTNGMDAALAALFQEILPVGSYLQCMLVADHRIDGFLQNWRAGVKSDNEIIRELADRRVKYFQDNALNKGYRMFRVFISYSQEGQLDLEGEEKLLILKEQIMSQLKSAGIGVWEHKPEGLMSVLDGMLFPSSDLMPEYKSYNPLMSISEQLVDPGGLLVRGNNDLIYDNGNEEWKTKIFSFKRIPFQWEQGLMGELIGSNGGDSDLKQLPCDFMLVYGVYMVPKSLLSTDAAKSDRLDQQVNDPKLRKKTPNITAQAEEWNYVNKRIDLGDRYVKTSMSVVLQCSNSDPRNMIKAEQKLHSIYGSYGIKLKEDKRIQLEMLLSILPMSWGSGAYQDIIKPFHRYKSTLSYEPPNWLPLQAEWCGTDGHGMPYVQRRGGICVWNCFASKTNYNACWSGESGSGKSFGLQEQANNIIRQGGRCFIFDTGRSFQQICKLFGGTHLTFDSDSDICINPFSYIKPYNYDGSMPEKKYQSKYKKYLALNMSFIKQVVARMASEDGVLDPLQKSKISRAVRETWKLHGRENNITKIVNWLNSLDGDQRAHDLAEMLYDYTEDGVYGSMFNGEANVDLSNKMVVIEFQELDEQPDLLRVVQQIMVIHITNTLFGGDRKTKSCVIIDEAASMLSDLQMSKFIETFARKARKYRVSLQLGTQSISDYYVNASAKAIIENSAWRCVLGQREEAVKKLSKSGEFCTDPWVEQLLLGLKTDPGKYSEMCLRGNNQTMVLRLVSDEFTSNAYSTTPADYVAIKEKMANGLSIVEAIEERALEKKQLD
jgi:conjugal transfer ATP-binding protein TraC